MTDKPVERDDAPCPDPACDMVGEHNYCHTRDDEGMVAIALHDLCAAAYTRGYREGAEDAGGTVDSTSHGDGVSQYLVDEAGARETFLAAHRNTGEG